MTLRPLDPFLCAMKGVCAVSHIVDGDMRRATEWAEMAGRSPGAHSMIFLVADVAHALNDDPERAAHWASKARASRADIGRQDFFRAFPFAEGEARDAFSRALASQGL